MLKAHELDDEKCIGLSRCYRTFGAGLRWNGFRGLASLTHGYMLSPLVGAEKASRDWESSFRVAFLVNDFRGFTPDYSY